MPHDDTTPTVPPREILAGTTLEWDRDLEEHLPSDNWRVHYHGSGPGALDITSSPSSDETVHEIREAFGDTSSYVPGTYRVVEFLEKTDGADPATVLERYELTRFTLRIQPDFSQLGTDESHAEKVLGLLEAQIEGRVPKDMESFQINGRAIQRLSMAELVRFRGIYARMVHAQRHPGRMPGRKIRVTF